MKEHDREQDITKKKEKVIDELNRFLKGRYMGVHQYEHLIHRAKDLRLKELLQQFQEDAKLGAQRVARRIQELGGQAADGVGVMGEVREWMQRWKDHSDDSADIVRAALTGETRYGIRYSHDMVAGELDEESVKIIDTLLEEDQKRADRLEQWLAAYGQVTGRDGGRDAGRDAGQAAD